MVGGDDLALRVCEELCTTRGHEVVLLWHADERAEKRVLACGARYCAQPPSETESLRAVGVEHAAVIMPVAADDRLNLQIALKARDMNPQIRIVLRQFNRALGRKIAQNVPNCAVVSPASHAAATYAAAAIDPGCLFALQFPDVEGPLVGFSERRAADFGLGDTSVAAAERRLGVRIAAINGRVAPDGNETVRREDRLVAVGEMERLRTGWARHRPKSRLHLPRTRLRFHLIARTMLRTDPLLRYTLLGGLILFFGVASYFAYSLHLNYVQALYFTASTMLTVGYGDITPYNRHAGTFNLVVAILIMFAGVTAGGIFIATLAAALGRAQETALHGLRRIRGENHVVICGAGTVGTRVIDYLLAMGERTIVIEKHPSAAVLDHARRRQIDLLQADATSDDALDFCDLPAAQSLLAITDSDTANLEAALGARARSPDLWVVMRIQDPGFSNSVERNFLIERSFSASELAAPTIAGLARFPGTRGRLTFAGETFNVGERSAADRLPRAEGTVPLFAWREGNLRMIHDFGEVGGNDRLLYVVPLSQFRPDA